jgi:hypothetical protein
MPDDPGSHEGARRARGGDAGPCSSSAGPVPPGGCILTLTYDAAEIVTGECLRRLASAVDEMVVVEPGAQDRPREVGPDCGRAGPGIGRDDPFRGVRTYVFDATLTRVTHVITPDGARTPIPDNG